MFLYELKETSKGSPELLAKILYAERICSILDIKFDDLVGGDFPDLLSMSDADINAAIIKSQKVEESILSDVEKEALITMKEGLLSGITSEIIAAESSIRSLLREAARCSEEVQNRLDSAVSYSNKKKALEKSLGTTEFPTLEDLFKNPFFKFLEVMGNTARFITSPVVMVKKVEEKCYRVSLGTYLIKMNLGNKRVEVFPDKNNLFEGEYYHPYISASGRICWGNSVEIAANMLMNNDFKGYLELLQSLLCDYCVTTTPYVDLMDFHRKQEIRLGLAEEPEPTCDNCGSVYDDCSCYTCSNCSERVSETCDSCEVCNDCDHRDDCENN